MRVISRHQHQPSNSSYQLSFAISSALINVTFMTMGYVYKAVADEKPFTCTPFMSELFLLAAFFFSSELLSFVFLCAVMMTNLTVGFDKLYYSLHCTSETLLKEKEETIRQKPKGENESPALNV